MAEKGPEIIFETIIIILRGSLDIKKTILLEFFSYYKTFYSQIPPKKILIWLIDYAQFVLYFAEFLSQICRGNLDETDETQWLATLILPNQTNHKIQRTHSVTINKLPRFRS